MICNMFYSSKFICLPDILIIFTISWKSISAEIRERDWCNVVTCHMDTAQAYVWRLQNFVLGEHILKPRPENPTPVKVRTLFTISIVLFQYLLGNIYKKQSSWMFHSFWCPYELEHCHNDLR